MNDSSTGIPNQDDRDPCPFAAEGGISVPMPVSADPYAALDNLMKVVEALCPVWPERETFKEGQYWLL